MEPFRVCLCKLLTIQSAEVVFAKSYRNEVLISTIWYSKTNCFYVYLTSSSGEEQALVDTMFPYVSYSCACTCPIIPYFHRSPFFPIFRSSETAAVSL